MSLCPYAYLELSLSGFLTASDKGSLTTFGELFNISALDPLLPTLLIATLCLCVLLTIFYYSLVAAWEVFWASRRSPSPLDPSAEVVLTALTGEEASTAIGDGVRAACACFHSMYNLTREGSTGSQFWRVRVRCCRHVLLSRYRRDEYLKNSQLTKEDQLPELTFPQECPEYRQQSLGQCLPAPGPPKVRRPMRLDRDQ